MDQEAVQLRMPSKARMQVLDVQRHVTMWTALGCRS